MGMKPSFCDVLVDIGSGRKMYMECMGSGSPTVILIPGYRDRGDFGWNTLPPGKGGSSVFSAVGQFTRVCTYDRPGTILPKEETFEKSRSDPVSQPSTVKDAAMDLHALLNVRKIEGPYVIVGHSMGGLMARLYAAIYPKDICGLVLVDSTTEDLKTRWTPEQWKIFEDSITAVPEDLGGYKNLEQIDIEKSFSQMISSSMVPVWKIRTTILSSDRTPDTKLLIKQGLWPSTMTEESAKEIIAAVNASQDNLAKLFGVSARHIKNTNSGHYIQKDNPQLVIDTIREHVNNTKCRP